MKLSQLRKIIKEEISNLNEKQSTQTMVNNLVDELIEIIQKYRDMGLDEEFIEDAVRSSLE